MRIKLLLSFIALFFFMIELPGQGWRISPYEIHTGLGWANYFGDIGGSADENTWLGIKNIDFARTRPALSGGVRYFFRNEMALNGALRVGWLSGTDKGWKNNERGYQFDTYFAESSITVEYFFVKDYQLLRGVNRRGMVRTYSLLSAYLFAGTGALLYNVNPNDALKERRDSDNIRHGVVTISLPAGFGMKLGISNTFDVGLETGVRYSLNDYLDGFTSIFSNSNDYYYITNINLIYKLPLTR
jgi:hypothetical protein